MNTSLDEYVKLIESANTIRDAAMMLYCEMEDLTAGLSQLDGKARDAIIGIIEHCDLHDLREKLDGFVEVIEKKTI